MLILHTSIDKTFKLSYNPTMPALTLDNLEELYEFEPPEQLPVELALDPYHPDNDEYTKRTRALRAHIITQSRNMRPKHVKAAHYHIQGMTNIKIAELLSISSNAVYTILRRDDTKKLLLYLAHLNRHEEGATVNHRKAILYRIAIDNEKERPNTSITALQELNKIDGVYKDTSDKSKVEIVINTNGFLPQTILDITPEGIPERES